MNNDYSYKIENVNFILIFLIVCLHASLKEFVSDTSIWYNVYYFIEILCDIAVPTFLFVSSYLFYRNFEISKYKQKVVSRIKSLVIPYFLWSLLMYLYYVVLGSIPFVRGMINSKIFELSLKSAFDGIILGSACPVLWFVRVLFILCIISPLIFIVCKKLNKFLFVFVILCMLLLNIIFNIGYSSVLNWLPLHMLGAYISLNKKNFNVIKKNKMNTIIMLFIIAVLIVVAFIEKDNYSFNYYIYRFVSPFCVLYFLDNEVLNKRYINILDSFFVYCIHIPIIEVVRKVFIRLLSINYNFLIYVLTIITTLFVIFLVSFLLKKYFCSIYMLLIGGRKKKIIS